MKNFTWITALLLVVSFFLGFAVAKMIPQAPSAKISETSTPKSPTVAPPITPINTTEEEEEPKENTSADSNTGSESDESETPITPADPPIAVDPLPEKPIKPVTAPVKGLPTFDAVSDARMSKALLDISDNMIAQNLAYDSGRGQDCSGIFHRIKDSLQVRFPSLKEGDAYTYPKFAVNRSTRQLVDWYHQNGNLKIIHDPIAARNAIRPGSVMFFGRGGEKHPSSSLNIDKLTNRKNNYARDLALVNHVAIVTDVKKDEDGNVTGYTMMHARYSKNKACKSGSLMEPPHCDQCPPFGNWSQQWLAVANVVTEKT